MLRPSKTFRAFASRLSVSAFFWVSFAACKTRRSRRSISRISRSGCARPFARQSKRRRSPTSPNFRATTIQSTCRSISPAKPLRRPNCSWAIHREPHFGGYWHAAAGPRRCLYLADLELSRPVKIGDLVDVASRWRADRKIAVSGCIASVAPATGLSLTARAFSACRRRPSLGRPPVDPYPARRAVAWRQTQVRDGGTQVSQDPMTNGFVLATDPMLPPHGLEGAVYAIGNFDGLHRGHQAVIGRAVAMAKRERPRAPH